MAYRRFTDRDGMTWEVRDRSAAEWEFQPADGAAGAAVRIPSPGYEKDPFELSREELQRLLDAHRPSSDRPERPSPFTD